MVLAGCLNSCKTREKRGGGVGMAYIVDEAGSLLLRWGCASFLLTGDGTSTYHCRL